MKKLIFILLLAVCANALNYTLSPDGKYVSWENENALINCTAYSNELIHQSQICNFTYTGASPITLNSSIVFNLADGVKPKSVYLWQNISHTLYRNVPQSVNHTFKLNNVYMIATTTAPCDWGTGAIKRNITTIDNLNNSYTSVFCFDSYINQSPNYTIYSVFDDQVSQAYTSYFFDWNDITSSFSIQQFGTYKVGTAEATWTPSQTRRVRFDYDTLPNTNGKFDIYFHTGSAEYAKNNPSAVKLILDPWWNATWNARQCANISSSVGYNLTNQEMQFALALPVASTNGSDLRVTWYNFTSGLEQSIPFWRAEWDVNYNESGTLAHSTIWNGATASGSVWAKLPVIANGTNTEIVCFYYNASSVSDASNGTNTFQYFNDGTDLHGLNTSGTVVNNDGYINASTTSSYFFTTSTYTTNSTVQFSRQMLNAASGAYNGLTDAPATYGGTSVAVMIHDSSDHGEYRFFRGGGAQWSTKTTGMADVVTWNNHTIVYTSEVANAKILLNGTAMSLPATNYPGKQNLYLCIGSCSTATTVLKANADNITIKSAPIVEPTYVLNGAEVNPADWTYYRNCTVNTTVSSSLTNFPVHCIIDTQTLISASKMNTSCQDLRPINTTTNIPFSYEIENGTCNTTTTVVWIRLPATEASANTTIPIYYGNPSASDAQNAGAVWYPANAMSVWHGGDLHDSLNVNNLTGTGISHVTNQTACKLGKCFEFTNANSLLEKTSATYPIGSNTSAMTMWGYKTTDMTNDNWIYFISSGGYPELDRSGLFRLSGGGMGTTLWTDTDTQTFILNFTDFNYTDVKALNYYHFTAVDGSQLSTIQINKTRWNGTVAMGASTTGGTIWIGGNTGTGSWNTDGIAYMDEVRLYNDSKSEDWMDAEYGQTDMIGAESGGAVAPNVDFVSQYHPDLNITNAQNDKLTINYTINDTDGDLNYSSIILYYKANSTTSNVHYYLNGTAYEGYFANYNYTNITTYNFTWTLLDNEVYPGTFNTGAVSIDNKVHISNTTNSPNDYYLTEYYNISDTLEWGYFEIAANTSGVAGPSRVLFCNSSYTSGNVASSPYCTVVATRTYTTTFDHCHTNSSCHIGFQFAINTTTKQINNVTVTSTGYFAFGGAKDWHVYNIAELVRIGMTKSTTNRGVTWTNETYTIDQHLHQFNASADSTFYYYACANDTAGNQNCSTVRSDLMQLAGLPPSSPNVYSPTQSNYSRGLISINYTAAVSPNAYNIVYYNISLLNSDFSFNSTIQANNSNNLSYNWDASTTKAGTYYIRVEAYDNQSQTSYGYSDDFNLTDSYWVSPTPLNATNNFTYGMVFNFTSQYTMTNCLIEVDGANQTGTVSGDNLSCSYSPSYIEHIFNNTYDLRGFANYTGIYTPTNETRTFNYYGCGMVKSNATLLNLTNRTGGTCFTINGTSPVAFNGVGYLISGSDAGYGIHVNYTNATITNAIISNFSTGIYVQSDTNITNTTISDCLVGGIDIESLTNFSNNTVYNNTGYGVQARGSDSIILNNTIYNNTNVNLYVNANGINASDNLLYNSTIGIDARGRDNVSLSLNHYHNNTWDLAINGTNYAASYEIFDINGSMLNYTNLSFSVVNTNGTINFTWSTNSTNTSTGTRPFLSKYINISSGAGTPKLDNVTFYWTTAEIGAYNESRFHLYKYNTTGWTDLNTTPDTTNNNLILFDLYPAGLYGINEWYNETLCPVLTNVYAVTGMLPYMNFTSTNMSVNATIELNNTCPVAINPYYSINDSTATATNTTYNVTMAAYELKNFTQYPFQIPANLSDSGAIAGSYSFLYSPLNNHRYNMTVNYTRQVLTPYVQLPLLTGDARMVYQCTNGVCALVGTSWVALGTSETSPYVYTTGGSCTTWCTYIESFSSGGLVGGGGGGGGLPGFVNGTITQMALSVPISPDTASKVMSIAPCLIILGLILLLYLVLKRKRR